MEATFTHESVRSSSAAVRAASSADEIGEMNRILTGETPQQILAWAMRRFGDKITLACSFGGTSGVVLLDMVARINPDLRVFYLDTDFLFPETYRTRDAAIARYGLTTLGFRSKYSPEEQAAKFGPELWRTNPDRCCALRKVEPNERALVGMDAWIAGLRCDQSATRRDVLPVQWDAKFGLYKIAPLYDWTEADVQAYIGEHDVPVNALHAEGYTSIGCTHCTRANGDGGNLRAGRWAGTDKVECGLHR